MQLLFVGGQPSGVQLPSSIELTVTDTEPGVKGDTVSNVTKPATLETGAVVAVPLFVNPGDRIKVDPREWLLREQANGGVDEPRHVRRLPSAGRRDSVFQSHTLPVTR